MPAGLALASTELTGRLADIQGRGPGRDGERRATAWLRDELRGQGYEVAVQAAWVRPDWATVHALHCALLVVGSVLSVPAPVAGLAVLGVTLTSLVGDLSGALPLLRRLTPARATQNLIVTSAGASPPAGESRGQRTPVRLVLTANLDAGRSGTVYRDGWARLETRARRALGGRLPSPLTLLTLVALILTGIAAARVAGAGGAALGAVQLVPTLAALTGFALLLDVVLSPFSPGANANASGVAAALSVLQALDRSPPQNLEVAAVLAGAGESPSAGIAAFLRDRRRRGWRAEDIALLAFEPCGVGRPRWWTHDGPLLALSLHPQLTELARRAAAANPQLQARAHHGHGASAAYAARRRRWPALVVGALDDHDRPGPARQARDRPERIDPDAVAATADLALAIVGRLDRQLGAPAPAPGD